MSLDSEDHLVWRALGDPTRRKILDLLRARPRTTGELAAEFAVTRFAVMKHLSVLTASCLVLVERRGRERYNHLNTIPIQQIYRRWIRPFEAKRADPMLRLKAQLEARSDPTSHAISKPNTRPQTKTGPRSA